MTRTSWISTCLLVALILPGLYGICIACCDDSCTHPQNPALVLNVIPDLVLPAKMRLASSQQITVSHRFKVQGVPNFESGFVSSALGRWSSATFQMVTFRNNGETTAINPPEQIVIEIVTKKSVAQSYGLYGNPGKSIIGELPRFGIDPVKDFSSAARTLPG